jgi:inosine-uridine nucleoside N-ribohydrolase
MIQPKIIFDTDIADDIDDAYALGLLTKVPNVKILGVTTCFGDTAGRAKVAAKLLHELDHPEIPVHAGRHSEVPHRGQFSWAEDYSSKAIKSLSAVEFMRQEIIQNPKMVTIVAVGPLTNLGDLITLHPEVVGKIKQVVIMGGSFHVGYNNQPPINPEWNIVCDPPAAKTLFNSGIPVVCAGLDATTMMSFGSPYQDRLTAYKTPGTTAIADLQKLWGTGTPTLFDPVAVAYAAGFRFSTEKKVHVEVDEKGFTHVTPGTPNVTILVEPKRDEFLEWYVAMFAPRNSSEYIRAIESQKIKS